MESNKLAVYRLKLTLISTLLYIRAHIPYHKKMIAENNGKCNTTGLTSGQVLY